MRSLQLKLILGITMILALCIFTWQYLELRAFRQVVYQNLINSCENMVEVIDKIWEEHMLTHKILEAKKEIKIIGEIERVKLIYFVNQGGKVRFSSNPRLIGKTYAREEILQVEKTNRPYFKLLEKDAENTFLSLTPIANKPECQQCHREPNTIGYIGLDLDVKEEIGFLSQLNRNRMKRIAVLSPIFYFLLILAISLFLQVNIHRPLEIIRRGLNKVKNGIFGEKIVTKATDEIGELANSFNLMTETLQETSEELIRSAKMSTLGHLAVGISEELQKPLNSIQTNENLLRKRLAGGVDLEPILQNIEKNFALAQRTITNLVQFAGPAELQLKPTNLNLSLEEAILQADKENLLKKIKVNKKLTPNLPILELDQGRIKQALYNLVLNACEAMPEGGELTVSSMVRGKILVIEINDTGKGIPEDKIQDIFNPFFTTKAKGLGLGLMVIKENLERHKAKIEVDSFVNKGTMVRIEFPLE
jgi:two-component system NtrC family sensor kinase